jgi:16S rRNA processing protein RimM
MPKTRRSSSPLPAADEKLVLVGRIGAAHGVKGEVRLISFTQDPKAIGAYGPLSDARRARQFMIVALRPLKHALFVARLEGVGTCEAATALSNTDLYLSRDALAPTAEDEFYHADLIGLAAQNTAGEHVGRVANVLNFGGGDILEIEPAAGGETLLLPFTKEAVPFIDLAGRQIVIAPPAEIEAESSFEPDVAPEPAPARARAR